MSKEEKKYSVTVLRRYPVTIYPQMGVKEEQIAVVYVAAGLPPETLFIPKSEYSKEKEKQLIRQRIEERLKEKPERYEV